MTAAPPARSFAEIPGPPGDFLHGNTVEFHAGRIAFLEGVVASYGNLARYRFGCDRYFLVNDPELVRELFSDWDHTDNAINTGWLYLHRSFLGIEGRDRVEPRRRLHASMCPRQLLAQHDAMAEAVETVVGAWRPGQECDVLTELLRLGVELVARAVFGQEAERCVGPVVGFLADLEILTGAYTTLEDAVRFDLEHRRAAFVELDRVITEAVAAWQRLPSRPDCILRALVESDAFDERALVHEVCVILLSNVSAAAAAAWSLYALAGAPRVRERLELELDVSLGGQRPGALELARLSYLDRVVKEALRLYPPLGLIGRRVMRPWQWGPLELSPGTRLHVSPYLLHRDPQVWHRPLEMDPDRFDPTSPSYRAEAMASYMPFGHGIRRCIGDQLSLLQVKLVVAAVTQRMRVELRPGSRLRYDLAPLGALVPEGVTMPMRIEARPVRRPTAAELQRSA